MIISHLISITDPPRNRWCTALGPTTNLTGPRRSMLAFVSAVNGVEARTQTSPDASLIAVVRPPILNIPSRVNGLVEENCHNDSLIRSGENTRREGPYIADNLGAKDSIRKGMVPRRITLTSRITTLTMTTANSRQCGGY